MTIDRLGLAAFGLGIAAGLAVMLILALAPDEPAPVAAAIAPAERPPPSPIGQVYIWKDVATDCQYLVYRDTIILRHDEVGLPMCRAQLPLKPSGDDALRLNQ